MNGLVTVVAATTPNPTVTGPMASADVPGSPTHNYTSFATNHDLASHGYIEQEFLVDTYENLRARIHPESGR
jgi:hypothetical protein